MNFNSLVCVLLLEKIRKTCQIKKMQFINKVSHRNCFYLFRLYKKVFFKKRISLSKEYRILAQRMTLKEKTFYKYHSRMSHKKRSETVNSINVLKISPFTNKVSPFQVRCPSSLKIRCLSFRKKYQKPRVFFHVAALVRSHMSG